MQDLDLDGRIRLLQIEHDWLMQEADSCSGRMMEAGKYRHAATKIKEELKELTRTRDEQYRNTQ